MGKTKVMGHSARQTTPLHVPTPQHDPVDSPDYPQACSNIDQHEQLENYIRACQACPRLVDYRAWITDHPAPGFTSADYVSLPLPSFGDPQASILVVGLAPSAHGSNRTGRMFTGDRSGDYLFASLIRTGLAQMPGLEEVRDNTCLPAPHVGDHMELNHVLLAAPVRCVPPDNKPTSLERARCGPYLARELDLVAPSVIVALGAFGWEAVCKTLAEQGYTVPKPRPTFGHGKTVEIDQVTLLGCYHPSPHNTYTGRLTPQGIDDIFTRAKLLAGV